MAYVETKWNNNYETKKPPDHLRVHLQCLDELVSNTFHWAAVTPLWYWLVYNKVHITSYNLIQSQHTEHSDYLSSLNCPWNPSTCQRMQLRRLTFLCQLQQASNERHSAQRENKEGEALTW